MPLLGAMRSLHISRRHWMSLSLGSCLSFSGCVAAYPGSADIARINAWRAREARPRSDAPRPPARHSARMAAAALVPVLLTACGSTARWDPDDRYTNVPLQAGQPLQAQRAPMGYAGAGYQTRLKAAQGSMTLDRAAADSVVTRLLRHYRGELGESSGVRDERYFLISIQPDVMVVAPFVFKLALKTAAQIQGLGHDVVRKVMNPLREQIRQQQAAQGLGMGWLAELPGPNYAELGCAFPDLPGAVLWAAPLGAARPLDDEARTLLADQLQLTLRPHPTLPGHWQLAGCPS